ncbi:MAG TPA: DUF883 family protein [Spongiibacteraceae bacterium]|nr:DUF883 family protein [Spongiibacteraceae bacterium]
MARAKVLTTRETLIADLNKIIVDAEHLLKAAGDEGGEQAKIFREKVATSLSLAKERLFELEEALAERTKVAVQAADSYVQQHPWQTVGLVGGAGILIGLLLNRR